MVAGYAITLSLPGAILLGAVFALASSLSPMLLIFGLSGVLTMAVDSMKNIVDEIEGAGLRDTTKIIIGGPPTSQEACEFVRADDWAFSPQKTVEVCSKWASQLT